MSLQLSIFPLTARHNRHKGNEAILNENREHFSNQTQKVLDYLLKGEKVSGLRMVRLHGIQDIRPRIAAIKKMGYELIEEKIKDGHGAKQWFLKTK